MMDDVTIQTAISGKETRINNQSYPRYQFDLTYNILRSAAAYTEYQQLLGFINSRYGRWDTFLYTADDDNSVTGQTIGTGDGTTTAFQLLRTLSGFIEPVLAPNIIGAVYLNGLSIPTAGYSAATNGALTQTSSGSLGASTRFVRSTWVTESGETATSVESSLAVSANHVLNVAAPSSPPAGAIGWNIYVSHSTATETRQNSSPIALGTPWVEPNTGLTNTGAAFPLTNTTGWSVSNWGTSSPGVLTFSGAPANSILITADFTFYWPCRFDMDKFAFSEFMSGLYELKKLSLITVKN
jgi:hypothetical protein